jgi:GAF domain-containing protein
MALVAFSPSRSSQQEDLHPYERLALHLSSCFSTIEPDDVEKCVAEALAGIGTTFGVDECTLVAYCERGVVKVVHSWAAAPHPPTTDDDLASMPWLVQRLARNAVVATTPASDLPAAAAADTEHAARTGVAARLAVPVAMGGRVVNGLIVGSRQRHVEWRVPVIERLTLMGEILGSGLERVRQQDALRASHGESGRFGDAAQAETVYLREEARNQVGPSRSWARARRCVPRWRAWVRSRRSMRPCFCLAKRGRARSCSLTRCTTAAGAVSGCSSK